MNFLRAFIVAGQLGKIWSKSSTNRKIFQSMSVLGYFYLMESINNGNNQVFTLNDEFEGVREPEPKTKIVYKKITFDNRPW